MLCDFQSYDRSSCYHPLQALHSAGVVHRDLKPSNVWLCQSGGRLVAKVGDCGSLSRFAVLETMNDRKGASTDDEPPGVWLQQDGVQLRTLRLPFRDGARRGCCCASSQQQTLLHRRLAVFITYRLSYAPAPAVVHTSTGTKVFSRRVASLQYSLPEAVHNAPNNDALDSPGEPPDTQSFFLPSTAPTVD